MNQSTNIKLTAEISATSKGLVDALNQASSAVNSTSESWKSRFDKLKDSTSTISQGVKNLGDLMKNIGDVDPSSMSKMTEALGEVSSNFDRVKGEVDAFVQSLSQMKIEASNLGMPIEDYQRFADAVKASGVSMDEAKNMLQAMQQNIQAFANGVPEAEQLFSKLGVTLEQVSSNTVGANFQLLVNALNDTIPASERATQNMQLFKSSIDSTLQVAQQYQKTVSEQTNAYATDKEVQNAISLSSAIEKLGRQLSTLGNTEKSVTSTNGDLKKSTSGLVTEYELTLKLLEAISEAYGKYSESLKVVSKGTLDATSALELYAKECSELEKLSTQLFEINENFDWGSENHAIVDTDVSTLPEILKFLQENREKIENEISKVQEIMNQRIKAGAPVDTTELETAIEHIRILKSALDSLTNINQLVGFDREDLDNITHLNVQLGLADNNFKKMLVDSNNLNNELDFKKITAEVVDFQRKLEQGWKNLKKGWKFKLDTKEIDEAIEKFQKLQQTGDKSLGYERYVDVLSGMKSQMLAINSLAEKNVSMWDRIKNAVKGAWNHVTHFRSGLNGANGESENLSKTITKGIGQMMGMGSAVAVVTKAMRNLVSLAKEYVKQMMEAKKAMTYENLAEGAEDMARVRDKRNQRNDELMRQLKEYSSLVREERETGSKETMAKRLNLQDTINKQYGMHLNAANRGDIDREIGIQLQELQQKRMKANEKMMRQYARVSEGVDKFINQFDKTTLEGWKNMMASTFHGDFNGENAVKEAQERSTKAKEEMGKLMEEQAKLQKEDWKAQWELVNTGKETDKAMKERKEAEEKIAKEMEEAAKEIEEWQHSLTDTDRQKNLRAIITKYEELINEGADHKQAENVAILAITKMLQKEKEDEDKKNQELLKALEQRIEAYKRAYKDYVEADKAVKDAKKAYAQTQKELANEDKKDAMEKKRQRLQNQMGRFGFRPYDGFSLDEKSSARRERRRNAQLDASIADKMSKSQGGERVHFTHAEKERIQAFEKLQKKDKALEASQKAMEAAEKQKNAAQKLEDAAKAIKDAVLGRTDAKSEVSKAGKELREASAKRRTVAKNERPDQIFEKARKNLYARGVAGASATKQLDYSLQFQQLHTDLQQLNKRVFVVK